MRTPLAELNGEDVVRAYVDQDELYLRRAWLEEKVEAALAEPGCRFVLVLGEPGAGKTALQAGLARRYPLAARYFIRRGSRSPLNSGDAQSMLLSVGHQLAAVRPELFATDRLEVSVRQQAERVAAGGSVIGIRVGDLNASPFSRTVLEVDQEAGEVAGSMTGLEVGTLSVDERVLTPSVLQYLALIEPARVLAEDDPGARLIVLIDALDELRFQDSATSVLGWLDSCPELPGTVRIVLTSRYDDRLLAAFRQRQRSWLREIAIEAEPERVEADLARYAVAATAEGSLIARGLRGAGIDAAAFAAGTVRRADGNFLYLATVLRSMESAAVAGHSSELAAIADLDSLPPDLADLYAFFLVLLRDRLGGARIPAGDGWTSAWEGLYLPVLALLTVGREPLSAEVIAAAVLPCDGIRRVAEALDTFRPFLDVGEHGYRLYHVTLAEFLIAEETRRAYPALYLESAEGHRLLGQAVLREVHGGRVPAEDYLVRHGTRHLLDAGGAGPDLARLLTDLPLLERRLLSGPDPVLEDLHDGALLADEPLVRQLRTAIDRQARHLRRDDLTPEFAVQQLLADAVRQGATELRESAERRLDELARPVLRVRWTTSGASESLLRVIEHKVVFAVATARDCPLALSAARSDGTAAARAESSELALWNLDTGVLLGLVQMPRIWNIALTSDGALAVVALEDGPVRVLRMPGGDPADPSGGFLPPGGDGRTGIPIGLALTPDDTVVAVRMEDETVSLFDLATGGHLATLEGSAELRSGFQFSPDGSLLLGGAGEGRLLAWEVPDGQARPFETAPVGTLKGVAVSEGVVVATADAPQRGDGAHAVVWELPSGRLLRTVPVPGRFASSLVAVAPDGAYGACLIWDDRNHILGFATDGSASTELGQHDDTPRSMLALPDGRILTGGDDEALSLWDPRSPGRNALLTGHGTLIRHLVPATGGRVVSLGSFDWFCVWDPLREPNYPERVHHRHTIHRMAPRGHDTLLTTAAGGTEAYLWRWSDGLPLGQARLPGPLTADLAHTVRIAGNPSFTRAWVRKLRGPRKAGTGPQWSLIIDVAVDRVRRRIVTVTDGGLVTAWRLRWSPARPLFLRRPLIVTRDLGGITGYGMSRDGNRGVLVLAWEDAVFWDLGRPVPLVRIELEGGPRIGSAAVSPGGRWCVCAGDGVLTLWDLDAQELVSAIQAPTSAWMYCWYVADDGSYALTSDAETVLQHWEFPPSPDTPSPPPTQIAFESRVMSVLSDPANGTIAVGTLRGDVAVLALTP